MSGANTGLTHVFTRSRAMLATPGLNEKQQKNQALNNVISHVTVDNKTKETTEAVLGSLLDCLATGDAEVNDHNQSVLHSLKTLTANVRNPGWGGVLITRGTSHAIFSLCVIHAQQSRESIPKLETREEKLNFVRAKLNQLGFTNKMPQNTDGTVKFYKESYFDDCKYENGNLLI